MNDLPRHTLARIIAKHGRGICDEPKRVEALLKDLCGAHRREINIIVGALDERVAADLIAAGKSVPRDVLLARLAARLRDNLAYTPEAARWGVETWAVVLAVLSEAELRERARAEAEEAARRAAPPPVRDPKPSPPSPPTVAPRAPQPQRGTTYAPPPPHSPPPRPPQTSPPPPARPPAAAQRRTPAPSPHVAVPTPTPRNVPPPLPTREPPRRGLKLRGCLLLFVLVVALVGAAVFVVPAVIALLQEETARPSINEPRIR